MQILTRNNRNFQKPSRNPSNRTKVKILRKNSFGYLIKKIQFPVCSVTAELFEHRNSGKNRRKRNEFFSENLRRAYNLIQVKKKFKIISCLCTFKFEAFHQGSFSTSATNQRDYGALIFSLGGIGRRGKTVWADLLFEYSKIPTIKPPFQASQWLWITALVRVREVH